MSDAYREYLELYDYFGREGLTRLTRDEFSTLAAELAGYVSRGGQLSGAEVDRAVAVRDLLLRDRPRRQDLAPVKRGRSR